MQADNQLGGLCYLLVCYRSVEYVAYLLASLWRPVDLFIIHYDAKSPISLRHFITRLVKSYSNILVIESREYSWAGYSHVEVSLRSIELALSTARPWRHFIFLSEEHLPLKSPSEIEVQLRDRRSMVAYRCAVQMGVDEHDDLANRFSARYLELLGVGCFAVELSERSDDFFERIYHGSNWMVLHRDHCITLMDEEIGGAFDVFRETLHAEENAILSVLAPWHSEFLNVDPTLVAFPHLVDNHGLIMTDHLFKDALSSQHLFIRKRTATLSDFVRRHIEDSHFEANIYRKVLRGKDTPRRSTPTADDAWLLLKAHCRRLLGSDGELEVHRVDPALGSMVPMVHFILRAKAMPLTLSVRILSENTRDYKVCLVEEIPFGPFRPPFVSRGVLYSNVRAKLFGLFGYRDMLPLNIEGGGFISLSPAEPFKKVIAVAERFLQEASDISAAKQDQGGVFGEPKRSDDDNVGKGSSMRAERINVLGRMVNARRYLEVGVSLGETFFDVSIPYKVGVDPNFRFDFVSRSDANTVFHQTTSDDFLGVLTVQRSM